MLNTEYPIIISGPPKPSHIIQPNIFSLAPGEENYIVEGGGAILVDIEPGDEVSVINQHGSQVCEILTIDHSGRTNSNVLNERPHSVPVGLKKLLNSNNISLLKIRNALEKFTVNLSNSLVLKFFDQSTPAKTTVNLRAEGIGKIIICAPGDTMDFELQNTVSPLKVIIKRAVIKSHVRFELPEPLANPQQDVRINTSTAKAIFVKAGEYIQIIDVDGRQCTDFQCFSARKLDKGIEHALDVTTTRTLMNHSYPMPGLHAKYYDQGMLPLVEVVQDTCGRHDAFALACSAKYYDDIGYPGHSNCSENFNTALSKFNVKERPGWMAINFFFNTNIDDHGVLYSDEPWSRPGDYVLLRALTDIVCVSSACPDDTSPANGWNPTDIHLRTYSENETFHRAVANRVTPNSELKMTKETGFHQSFSKFTRNFVEYNGYWLANCFGEAGPIEEYWACRKKAVILDLSPLRKFEITGPDSEALCQYVFTRDIKKIAVGGSAYTAMCYEHGGMLDDGILFKLGKDNFRWVGGNDYGGEWLREKAEELSLQTWIRSSTDQLHNIAIQGPNSRELLKDIIWSAPHNPEFDQLDWFRFTPARLNNSSGVPIVVSRTGYTGELGYEIMCHPKDCTKVFDIIWEAGKGHGLTPMGLEALDMVRIEAGLVFAGYEFCDQTDPIEAGIGFTVPLKSKVDDFIGRQALIRRKETPSKKLVGLDIDSNVDVGNGDGIYLGRAKIGEVTSSMRSPILNKNIALAHVDVTQSSIGTRLEIGKLDGQQKRLPATVVPFAHYDPKKERPRS